ncbi:MAG TPA: DUF4271 domain-containing protein [Lacibacter sp.]|nr:DUF4271 domain-containing protein [Lacibacter sp.]HMO88706.1 DUF4271 domain-containing protein [Lacibacter sp.]HMP86592.1 DUF4271 domain-containing protein [Lacibacter sp.]
MRFLLFLLLLPPGLLRAQDTPPAAGRLPATDTLLLPAATQPATLSYDAARNVVLLRLRLNYSAPGVFFIQKEKLQTGKDWLFYYLMGLLLLFGLLRLSYVRYFQDLFRFFFRTSLRINQIREQLVQAGLPSLLYNLFFACSFGLYIYLLAIYFQASVRVEEWMIPFIATAALAVLYLGKYLFIQASGWIFNIRPATETYTFIVFLINKVAGIAILPFLLLIAFAGPELAAVGVTLSLSVVIILFFYRFLRAYQPVQQELKVGRVHFFIYLLAVEVAPLLLIYKLLIKYF